MIVDIHSHILPGIDDGAKNMQETIDMIDMAVEEGIDAIIATPHYRVDASPEVLAKYQQVYEAVLHHIETRGIPLKLYQGHEIYYSSSILEKLQSGEVHTMNGTRYILVEFPLHTEYPSMKRALSMLLYAGYWPILAHTERYFTLRKHKRIHELVRMGVLIQINTNAITGKEGWRTKHFCVHLMKRDLVCSIGTDAHGSSNRRPRMKECIAYLDKKLGTAYRRQLCEKNPLKILEGEKII